MILKRIFCGFINILYIIVTSFTVFSTVVFLLSYFLAVFDIRDVFVHILITGYCIFSLAYFALNMITAGLVSFYSKFLCRISFIVGLADLALFVLWYNYLGMFGRDMYVILP